MKKPGSFPIIMAIAAGAVLALAAFPASAQTWHTANQATLAWDAVAPPDCTCKTPPCEPTVACPGPTWPSPAAGEMKYQVYIRSDPTAAVIKVGAEIAATQRLISFDTWGRYYLGVESVFYLAGESEPIRSARSWSNVAADASDAPFGVNFLPVVAQPGGLRLKAE